MENEDVDLIIPHQANQRIIETLAKHLSVPDVAGCSEYSEIRQYFGCDHSGRGG